MTAPHPDTAVHLHRIPPAPPAPAADSYVMAATAWRPRRRPRALRIAPLVALASLLAIALPLAWAVRFALS